MTKDDAVIRHVTKRTSGDAAAGRRTFSARAVAPLHFRAAVSQDAGARASKASDVLRDSDQAELPGLACAGGFLSTCHRRVDSRLCCTRRWHVEFDPARSATCSLYWFRAGKAVSDCKDRCR